MRKMMAVILLAIFVSACADGKMIAGKYEEPRGLAEYDLKNPKVIYKVSAGNVFWSVVLSETIFAPVILLGWYLWEPVGVKP